MFELIVTTRFLHIIIAATLLLSTSGVTITAYFCGEHLSGISFLAPSECSSELKACCKLAEGKKKCCTSESEFVQIDIEQQLSKIGDYKDIDFDQPLAIVCHLDVDEPIAEKVNKLVLYRPPPLIDDVTILYQVFLC